MALGTLALGIDSGYLLCPDNAESIYEEFLLKIRQTSNNLYIGILYSCSKSK